MNRVGYEKLTMKKQAWQGRLLSARLKQTATGHKFSNDFFCGGVCPVSYFGGFIPSLTGTTKRRIQAHD
jgi:hypothetical protein